MAQLALEIIAYQNQDSFPGELTVAIENIYDSIDKKKYANNLSLIDKSPEIARIEKMIFGRFNMKVVFDKELSQYIPAAVIPFMSDYLTEVTSLKKISITDLKGLFGGTNIFRHVKKLDKEKEEYLKRIHRRKGFVDKKNARLGGYLSDVKNYLIINFFQLKAEGLTPQEVVAVMLHELGHAFVGLETHHSLTTTNAVIAEIVDDINNNKQDRAYYVFKRHFNQEDIIDASLGGQKEITDFYGKLASTYVGQLQSQFLNGKYDETNYENLADSFATRFNVGKDLVSGLHKIHVRYGDVMDQNRTLWFAVLFVDMIGLIGWTFFLGGVVAAILAQMALYVLFGSNPDHMTYDDPQGRYVRIKNGIINNLKNQKLPVKLTKELVDQYLFIDELVKISQPVKSVFDFSEYLHPGNREDNYHIHLQQTVENNLNSVLFLKSAQLRTI